MTQKVKIIIGCAMFAVVITGAVIAYNALSKRVTPENDMGLSESTSMASDDANNDKQKAPDFTVTDQDGNSVDLSDLIANGKPIVLNFWTSWCPPCKAELPAFENVYKELGDEVQFVMINTLDRDTVDKGKKFIADAGYTLPIYFDTNKSEATMNYGVRSYPTTIFIDKDGYVITGAEGGLNEENLRKGIDMIQ